MLSETTNDFDPLKKIKTEWKVIEEDYQYASYTQNEQ